MTLGNLILIVLIVVVGILFWRTRAMAEKANDYLAHYCEQQGIQLISVARKNLKIGTNKGKLDWRATFNFEFSGNREDKYTGSLQMIGLSVVSVDLPPFRVS